MTDSKKTCIVESIACNGEGYTYLVKDADTSKAKRRTYTFHTEGNDYALGQRVNVQTVHLIEPINEGE